MAQRIGVIGAGILGLAIARRLTEVDGEAEVTVVDKEATVAAHQTGRNSGVAHAGLYYAPGSLKATLCRRGIGMLKDFCAEHDLPYDECGKLVIARTPAELPRLDEIERRALTNGVPGLRRLTSTQLTEIEPHARGIAAVHSPQTAIVDFPAVAGALASQVTDAGGMVRLGFAVDGITRRGNEVSLRGATGEELIFDRVVVCAGLQSDRLARLAGDRPGPAIIPFRGEYLRLVAERRDLVRGLIYPVPDPAYPFLGVHFTRRIGGTVDIGPNAVLALAREGYRRRDVSWSDTLEIMRAPAFRRLARRHWRMGVREMWGSVSQRAFVAEARTFVPELRVSDVVAAPGGIRAQAVDDDGSLVDDFRISELGGVVAIRNAPSPAATSSLAIAEHVVGRLYPQVRAGAGGSRRAAAAGGGPARRGAGDPDPR